MTSFHCACILQCSIINITSSPCFDFFKEEASGSLEEALGRTESLIFPSLVSSTRERSVGHRPKNSTKLSLLNAGHRKNDAKTFDKPSNERMLPTSSTKSMVQPENATSLTPTPKGESLTLNNKKGQWQSSLPRNSSLARGAVQGNGMTKQTLPEPKKTSGGHTPKEILSSFEPRKYPQKVDTHSKGSVTNETAKSSDEVRVPLTKTNASKAKEEAGSLESTIHSPEAQAAQPTESTSGTIKSVRAESLRATNQSNNESARKENHPLSAKAQRATSEGNRSKDILEPETGNDLITAGQIIEPLPLALNNSFVQGLTDLVRGKDLKPRTLKPDAVMKVPLTDIFATVSNLPKEILPDTDITSLPEKGKSEKERAETVKPSGALRPSDTWKPTGRSMAEKNMAAGMTIPPMLQTDTATTEWTAQEPPVEVPKVEERGAPFKRENTDTEIETESSAASPTSAQEPKQERGWAKTERSPPQPTSPDRGKPEQGQCSMALSGGPLPTHCIQRPDRTPGKAQDVLSLLQGWDVIQNTVSANASNYLENEHPSNHISFSHLFASLCYFVL